MDARSIVENLLGLYGCTYNPSPKDMFSRVAGEGIGDTQEANTGNLFSQHPPDLRRDDLFKEYLTQYVSLPTPDSKDPTLWPPDHIEEARHECTFEFIEQVLLPWLRNNKELTAIELVRLTTQFKAEFRSAHAQDFRGEYELIPAAEMMLIQMLIRLRARQLEHSPLYELVKRAGSEIRCLLNADEEFELYSI
jgi:hypothetical protein